MTLFNQISGFIGGYFVVAVLVLGAIGLVILVLEKLFGRGKFDE